MIYTALICILGFAGYVVSTDGREPGTDTHIEITGNGFDSAVPEGNEQGIQLQCLQACNSKADFALYIPSHDTTSLGNCTVSYKEAATHSASQGNSPSTPRVYTRFLTTRRYDTFHLEGLAPSRHYTVQVICDHLNSQVLPFTVKGVCDQMAPDIKVLFMESCASTAKLEWLFFQTNTSFQGLYSCCVRYGLQYGLRKTEQVPQIQLYKFLPNNGVFKLTGLIPDRQYNLDVSCGTSRSNVSTFIVSDAECTDDSSDVESEVPVVFEDEYKLFSTKDSILGIVFGLLGFLLIIITTFYVLRKVRRRQRLQRIRRYLGSSLVDPFENLENRMPHEDSSSERLMGSSDL